jgi:hypothetical protein
MKATIQNVSEVFVKIIETETKISWQEIVVRVKAAGLEVKNWLLVRRVMYTFQKQQKIVRTDNIFNEEYLIFK